MPDPQPPQSELPEPIKTLVDLGPPGPTWGVPTVPPDWVPTVRQRLADLVGYWWPGSVIVWADTIPGGGGGLQVAPLAAPAPAVPWWRRYFWPQTATHGPSWSDFLLALKSAAAYAVVALPVIAAFLVALAPHLTTLGQDLGLPKLVTAGTVFAALGAFLIQFARLASQIPPRPPA